MSEKIHRNCVNYAPLDVIKGICHLSKETVSSDQESCSHFTDLAKCGLCRNFCADGAHTGTCSASAQKFMAYTDMTAVTCQYFEAR